jgi:hypothetical protein
LDPRCIWFSLVVLSVVELHLRHFHLSANLPITDYQRLGSPAFGISTQLVIIVQSTSEYQNSLVIQLSTSLDLFIQIKYW